YTTLFRSGRTDGDARIHPRQRLGVIHVSRWPRVLAGALGVAEVLAAPLRQRLQSLDNLRVLCSHVGLLADVLLQVIKLERRRPLLALLLRADVAPRQVEFPLAAAHSFQPRPRVEEDRLVRRPRAGLAREQR